MALSELNYGFGQWPGAPKWSEFWDDFQDEYAAGPVTGTSPWISTLLSSGTVSMASTAADEAHGVIILSGAPTTDNSGAQLQRDMQTRSCTLGKRLRYKNRLRLSDGTQDEFFAGFAAADTTILDGTGTIAGVAATIATAIGFYKPDGETNVYGVMVVGSAIIAQTGALGTVTAATYADWSFEVAMDASVALSGIITFYKDGVPAGIGISSLAFPAATVILTESLAFVTGDASGTKTCIVDYIGSAQER